MSRLRRPNRLPRRYVRDERGRYTLRPDWVRTEIVIDVGLIVLGVYILQAFLSTGVNDAAGKISVVAWAVAIPQLAFLALLSQVLNAYRYYSYPWYVSLARSLGQGAAVIGFGGGTLEALDTRQPGPPGQRPDRVDRLRVRVLAARGG